jgi:dTDP-4-dehydrorhamnose 3,5-epimerase-like enzyme
MHKRGSLISLPKINDPRGNLTFLEEVKHIPFEIKKVSWHYDMLKNYALNGISLKICQRIIVSISGSFEVVLNYGDSKEVFNLNRSNYGLYIPEGIWHSVENFSGNALALLIESELNSEYTKDYKIYLQTIKNDVLNSGDRVKYQLYNKLDLNLNFQFSTVNDCIIVELSEIIELYGKTTIVRNNDTIPFNVQRIYYLYDVPGGEIRGGHAHKELYQLIVAAGGSFSVEISDGLNTKSFFLNSPSQGLLIVPGIWRELINFSSSSNCLVLASHIYDENDYIRDLTSFINKKNIQ